LNRPETVTSPETPNQPDPRCSDQYTHPRSHSDLRHPRHHPPPPPPRPPTPCSSSHPTWRNPSVWMRDGHPLIGVIRDGTFSDRVRSERGRWNPVVDQGGRDGPRDERRQQVRRSPRTGL